MNVLPAMALVVLASLMGCKKDEPAKQPATEPSPAAGEAPVTAEPAPTPAPEPATAEVIKLDGFATPEAVLWDEANDVYLVSNINGTPFEKDGNGFISRVSPPPNATVAERTWIDGKSEDVTLNAPKGMAILDGVLYVSDIDTVRMFDLTTGASKGEVRVKGAVFLNDLATGDGVVYASDTALDENFSPGKAQAIWEIRDGKATQLAKGAELGGPNGILVKGDEVWVAAFDSGELYRLGKDGAREAVEKLPKGQLDGIVATADGRMFVSSWEGKTIFAGEPGDWTAGEAEVTSPADIGLDTKRSLLLVPIFMENRVELHPLP